MKSRPTNLIIIAIDSLRSDHMSCYGYPKLTTPHIDRFAAQGVLCENSFSVYIPTTPGFSAMLTGRDVMATRMISLTPNEPLDPEIPTLPEILRASGYTSASIGFNDEFFRGFDQYVNYEAWPAWDDRPARKAENLLEVALPVLEELIAGQPFFLLLRYMEPHTPYLPPPPFDRMFYSGDEFDPANKSMEPVFGSYVFGEYFRSWMPPGLTDINYEVAQYDGELAYMDVCFAALLTLLEELKLVENSLLVVTSDHGETLTEHDCYFDHYGLYEPTLRVPTIFHLPDQLPPGRRMSHYTLLQDHMPTILDLLGQRKALKQIEFDGRSLLPLMRGDAPPIRSEFYLAESTRMRKRGWRTPQWKLIEALEPDIHNKPPVELYNLIEDPLELINVADREPAIVQHLQDRMMRWVDRRLSETGKGDPILDYWIGLDKKMHSIVSAKQQMTNFLENLGYV